MELPKGWKGESKEHTKQMPGKSHEKTIHEAEGNVSRHKPEAVREAKHVSGLQMKAQLGGYTYIRSCQARFHSRHARIYPSLFRSLLHPIAYF